MSGDTLPRPYTLRQIGEMLGLGRSVVMGLIHAGFVTPGRGPRNEYRFSFQDVVLLRTAHHLRRADIPPRRMLRSLRQLRARLPDSMPLAGLRIQAIGSEVAVRDAQAAWQAATGQLLMDFEVSERGGQVLFMPHEAAAPQEARPPASEPGEPSSAQAWFARGESFEGSEALNEAEAAYRRALALDPGHAHAALNLGALLCDLGRPAEAESLLQAAVERNGDDALLWFNLAVAREDGQHPAAALDAYARALALDPEFADAHYNAARLHEAAGDARSALRHYSAYRRLRRERAPDQNS